MNLESMWGRSRKAGGGRAGVRGRGASWRPAGIASLPLVLGLAIFPSGCSEKMCTSEQVAGASGCHVETVQLQFPTPGPLP